MNESPGRGGIWFLLSPDKSIDRKIHWKPLGEPQGPDPIPSLKFFMNYSINGFIRAVREIFMSSLTGLVTYFLHSQHLRVELNNCAPTELEFIVLPTLSNSLNERYQC